MTDREPVNIMGVIAFPEPDKSKRRIRFIDAEVQYTVLHSGRGQHRHDADGWQQRDTPLYLYRRLPHVGRQQCLSCVRNLYL